MTVGNAIPPYMEHRVFRVVYLVKTISDMTMTIVHKYIMLSFSVDSTASGHSFVPSLIIHLFAFVHLNVFHHPPKCQFVIWYVETTAEIVDVPTAIAYACVSYERQ